MNPPTVHRLPYREDPLRLIAAHLLDQGIERLPCSHVILPLSGHERLRAQLLREAERRGHGALLGPHLHDLPGLARALVAPSGVTLGAGARELLLVEALRQHATLFNHANPWALAEDLGRLFDQLTLRRTSAPRPDDDPSTFQARLARAYGADPRLAHLEREARLIHTLWQAYHQQLNAEGRLDDATDYVLRLARLPEALPPDSPLLVLADPRWSGAERNTIAILLQRPETTLFIPGDHHDPRPGQPEAAPSRLFADLLPHTDPPEAAEPSPRGHLLRACYGLDERPLTERARTLRQTLPHSPLTGQLAILHARDPEHQARAVALQLRDWHHQGLRRLGIVTEDRRLARRLRALLERHGLTLRDRSGWALSTTAAASTLERLLQCVEEDFPHQALLDLLHSPFLTPVGEAGEARRSEIHRLERDIIRQENIARGLQRYLNAITQRERRLGLPRHYQSLRHLLEELEEHTRPLQHLTHTTRPATRFIEALQQTLEGLGMHQPLAEDPAGARLLEELDNLAQAGRHHPLLLSWSEFRAWLGRTLERYNFVPTAAGATITLLNFDHATLQRFDALVICGLSRAHRPGSPDSPFFNRRVRRELGLADPQDNDDLALHQWRSLLEAAPRLLLTTAPETPDAPDPEPWLERLFAFHHWAYQDDLTPHALAHWAAQPYPAAPAPPPPERPSRLPRPRLRPHRLPEEVGAYAHQRLIDCPYRFYAGDGLGLTAPEAVRERMAKNDYGNLVHRILEAFHQGIPGLPGPYTGPWDEAHRQNAIALLEDVSQAVFTPELRTDFTHRAWLERWRLRIPKYVDWQIQRARQWHIEAMERRARTPLPNLPVTLVGRLDRIDRRQHETHRAVVDYKTGAIPRFEDVVTGEAVQLHHYALLDETIHSVGYLDLDHKDRSTPTVKESRVLEGETLETGREAVRARLREVLQAIHTGHGLPAWGDEASCRHCPFPGVCRRPQWDG